jgi:flagellar assembly factor FliW
MSVAAPTRPLEDSMTVEDQEVPTIDFVTPMPGFPEHTRFVLVRLDEDGMLYALTSIHDPALRFLVVPPVLFFPEYAPEVPEDAMELLDVTEAGQVLVLLVIAAGDTAADTTANLLAPILVNHGNRRAIQVVLTGSDLPVRASLMASA